MRNPVRTFCLRFRASWRVAIWPAQAPPAPEGPHLNSARDQRHDPGEIGAPPHYAVPDFIALTNEKETAEAAKLIAEVLWNDLSFEREYDMIPRDTYKTIDDTPNAETIAFDRWRELGADGVVKGTVRKNGQHVSGRDAPLQRARARAWRSAACTTTSR